MNDGNFHQWNDAVYGDIRKVCLARRNQESDLNPERCVLVWLSFGTGKRQGSSVVEQGTHKPLVGSSTLPPGMRRSTPETTRLWRISVIQIVETRTRLIAW